MRPSEALELFDWGQGCNFQDMEGNAMFPSDVPPEPTDAIRVCAHGAICYCGHHHGLTEKQQDEMREKIRERVGMSIGNWNDQPIRTKDEVMAMLRQVELEVLG